MERLLRLGTLVVAAVIGITAAAVASVQHLPSRPVANLTGMVSMPHDWALPNEPNGRVLRWENDRLLVAEAAAKAAAAAQAKSQKAKPPAALAATTIPTYPPGTVQDIITQAFTPLGATAVAWGLRVAKCESGYNPRAYNPAGPYYGLFQFAMGTFKATPFGGQDIYDPAANAGAAAWKYSRGGAGAWGCK